jgi:alkylation response protein AidB-like acyl-CoA dehydrogenase
MIVVRRVQFEQEHKEFAESFRAFIAKDISPHYLHWEAQGIVPRELFTAAGDRGFLGMAIPEPYGGAGVEDFRLHQVIAEELAAAGIGGAGLGITLHNDITTPYFLKYSTDEQKQRWLPSIASGESITAIAMTEPGVGSDLGAMATSARRDGSRYIVNGSKTFISNGINSDLVIVAAKTDPAAGRDGITLLIVERDMAGFERGRNLEKLGLHSQDTAELFFNDVQVPVANRLGAEGDGFRMLLSNLSQERLSIAMMSTAVARQALAWTLDYVAERRAFGRPISQFQNTRFVLAEVRTEVEITQTYIDRAVVALNAGELTPDEAAMAKWWSTELQNRVVSRCLQLFGGYGYMLEYPIARAFADARVATIKGGTTEIMKSIVARSMGL